MRDSLRFLESDGDKDTTQEIRIHFCLFTRYLIANTPLDRRTNFLPADLHRELYKTLRSWSGSLGMDHINKGVEYSELELAAVQAMANVLCCGTIFNKDLLNEGSNCNIYSWLNSLLDHHNEKVSSLIIF